MVSGPVDSSVESTWDSLVVMVEKLDLVGFKLRVEMEVKALEVVALKQLLNVLLVPSLVAVTVVVVILSFGVDDVLLLVPSLAAVTVVVVVFSFGVEDSLLLVPSLAAVTVVVVVFSVGVDDALLRMPMLPLLSAAVTVVVIVLNFGVGDGLLRATETVNLHVTAAFGGCIINSIGVEVPACVMVI